MHTNDQNLVCVCRTRALQQQLEDVQEELATMKDTSQHHTEMVRASPAILFITGPFTLLKACIT